MTKIEMFSTSDDWRRGEVHSLEGIDAGNGVEGAGDDGEGDKESVKGESSHD